MAKAYTDATRKPPTTYAAITMCAAINGMASLKMTDHGSTSTTLPAESSVNPCGEFIQALAATTETLPRTPVTTTGTPVQKCGHGFNRLPTEDVDRHEDGLGEEEDALERERDPERLTPLPHEAAATATRTRTSAPCP